MQPFINPAVVRAFHALLGLGMVWTSVLIVMVILFRGFMAVIGDATTLPIAPSLWRQPFRSAWRGICHRVGRTPKERALLWWGLGILWFIDGVLQAQPAMPNNGFAQDVLAPALMGQPSWYIRILGWNIQFWNDHPVGADVAATLLQVWIGILLLVGMDRFWGRLALWLSIGWGIGIWIFGEGMGGILAGSVTWLNGSPGSVLFYVVGAVLLLLPEDGWTDGRVRKLARRGFGVFWLAAAAAQGHGRQPATGRGLGCSGSSLRQRECRSPRFYPLPSMPWQRRRNCTRCSGTPSSSPSCWCSACRTCSTGCRPGCWN